MTYQNDINQGASLIYDIGGVPALYTDRDGATTNVNAIVDYELQQYGDVANVSAAAAAISVRTIEVQAPPRNGETYTVNGRVFTVSDRVGADELEHTVLVTG